MMEGNDKMHAMLTVKEVARLLHVHPNTLRRWSKDGRIKAYRIAPRGDRRFEYREIARFLAEVDTGEDLRDNGERLEHRPVTTGNKRTARPDKPPLSGSRNTRRSKGNNDS